MKQVSLTEGKFYHVYNRGNNRSNLFYEPAEYEHFLSLYDRYISPVSETLAWVLMPNHFHFVIKIKENVVYKYSNDNFNAVRSNDADRFTNEATTADLTASARPVNVKRNNEKAWFEEHKWETIELSSSYKSGEFKRPVPHRHFAHLFNAYTRYFNNRTGRTGNLFARPFKRKEIHNEEYLKQVILYVHNNPIHHGFCEHLLEYPWSSFIACISEKPTKLSRESVLNLFNEKDGFKKQHNHKVDIKTIEKYLKLDEVDYTTKTNEFNADRFNDHDRFRKEATVGDLSACEAPDNVNKKVKSKVETISTNADPEKNGTGRYENETTTADLTAQAGWRTDNVKKRNEILKSLKLEARG